MDEQLKKTEEVTTDVLLEYLSVESASDRSSSGGNTQNPSKSRSRTASVQKAKALLRGNRTSHREHSRSTLKHTDCTQPEASDPANQTQDEELTSEGFVIVSNSPVVVPAPCSPAIRGQGSCQSRHLSTATCGKTLKRSDSSVKRPDTLSLQPSKDPGDPPLFSPNTSEIAQSYPPCGAGLVKMTSYLSSPVLTKSCSPTSARASVHPQSCMKQSSTSDHIQQQRHCCALPPVSIVYMLILFKLCIILLYNTRIPCTTSRVFFLVSGKQYLPQSFLLVIAYIRSIKAPIPFSSHQKATIKS